MYKETVLLGTILMILQDWIKLKRKKINKKKRSTKENQAEKNNIEH